jgi:hypothetical protein
MSLDVDRLAEVILEGTKALIAKELAPLRNRIAELERKQVEFKGAYTRGAEYRRGDIAQRSGSAWLALRDDPGTPSENDGWLQLSKAGRE